MNALAQNENATFNSMVKLTTEWDFKVNQNRKNSLQGRKDVLERKQDQMLGVQNWQNNVLTPALSFAHFRVEIIVETHFGREKTRKLRSVLLEVTEKQDVTKEWLEFLKQIISISRVFSWLSSEAVTCIKCKKN